MTHSDILNLWPSLTDLARDMGKPIPTVGNWKSRNRIPMEYWVRLVRAAARRDIPLTYGQLAEAVSLDAA